MFLFPALSFSISLVAVTGRGIPQGKRSSETSERAFTIPVYYPNGDGFGKAATDVHWGTPSQDPVRTTFDSGSDSFWVDTQDSDILETNFFTGSTCSFNVAEQGFKVYNTSASISHTAIVPDKEGTGASYGGNAKSISFPNSTNDTMTWTASKDKTFSGYVLPNQEVGLATNTTTQVEGGGQGQCDSVKPGPSTDVSILGMGPASTWLSNLVAAKKILKPDWSVWFQRPQTPAPVDTFHGYAKIGGAPPASAYSGEIVDVPLIKDNSVNALFYTVKTPKLSVFGKDIPLISGGAETMILDSGTTQDLVPFNQTAIIAASKGNLTFYTAPGGFIFFAYKGSCDKMPWDLTLDYTFEGKSDKKNATVKVPLRNFAVGPVADSGVGAKLCNLNNFSPDNPGMSTFGVPFFTAAAIYFKNSQGAVGLAQGCA